MTKAFYAGSFDPLTHGHIYVINECFKLFNRVIIGVGSNPAKIDKYTFTPSKRRDIIWETFYNNTQLESVVTFSDRYTIQYAQELGCTHLVRGIRNGRDLEDEMAMVQINLDLAHPDKPVPSTVFIPTPRDLALVSSSMVKSLIGFDNWRNEVGRYIPPEAYTALLEKYDQI